MSGTAEIPVLNVKNYVQVSVQIPVMKVLWKASNILIHLKFVVIVLYMFA